MKKTKKTITAVDLFCGSGGSSTGLIQACEAMGLDVDLLAVNHWDLAIATHSTNHPKMKHLCTGVDQVDPRQLVRDGVIKQRINLLWASPECQHHSIARGGKPIKDQSRATAWCVLRWCEALYIDTVIIENVKEFQSWGPIGANGRPLKSKKGETFLAFINSLKSLGYGVDYRVLNAADYGDPTSRERLFIIARRGNKAVTFPEPTHAPKDRLKATAQHSLFHRKPLRPYRTAREIIDWEIQGESIFSRKRPLSPNTLARIFAGLKRYCGLEFIVPQFGEREGQQPRTHSVDAPLPAVTSHGAGALVQPFIVELRNNCDARELDKPLSTVAASGNHHALCQPFVIGQQSGAAPRSVEKPLPTISTDGAISLVQPFLIPHQGNGSTRSIDRPLQTITTQARGIALVQPFLVTSGGPETAPQSIDEPVRTLLTREHNALVEPFVLKLSHTKSKGDYTYPLDRPLTTVTGLQEHGLVEPFLVTVNHGQDKGFARRTRSIDEPAPSLTTSRSLGIAQPYLVKYNGTGGAMSVDEPLDTISTKDRYGLAIPELGAVLDIRFRMLQPHELSAAMGFPKTYVFTGTREARVKQIGNAVAVNQAKALCQAVLV
jgi:DNA (cytosine-5)-methyltransferase 1